MVAAPPTGREVVLDMLCGMDLEEQQVSTSAAATWHFTENTSSKSLFSGATVSPFS
jgi:hypothetical protein